MAAELAFKAAEEGDRAFCGRDDHQTLEAKKKLLSLRDEDGRTLVHVAAAGGQVEVVGWLIAAAAEGVSEEDKARARAAAVNTSDEEGWTPLLSASSIGSEPCVSALLAAGAAADSANLGGRTALHYAASKGHLGIARALQEAGADLRRADKVGCTPLHRAASAGKVEVCRWLLEQGAKVDAKDRQGQTPLMMAAICNHEEVALLLLQHGADIEAKDGEGETALTLCTAEDMRGVLRGAAQRGQEKGSADMETD